MATASMAQVPWLVHAAIVEITEVILCGWAMEALLQHAHQMSRLYDDPHDGWLVRMHSTRKSKESE